MREIFNLKKKSYLFVALLGLGAFEVKASDMSAFDDWLDLDGKTFEGKKKNNPFRSCKLRFEAFDDKTLYVFDARRKHKFEHPLIITLEPRVKPEITRYGEGRTAYTFTIIYDNKNITRFIFDDATGDLLQVESSIKGIALVIPYHIKFNCRKLKEVSGR
jgi:hypothetical protein